MSYTTIQILAGTRQKLSGLKESPRQTYDELLNKLLLLVPSGDEEGEFSEDFRIGLLNAKIQARTGKTLPRETVRKRLGLQ